MRPLICLSELTYILFCSNFLKCLSDKGSDFFGDNPEHVEDEMIKRIGEVADGVFQFSDLHECGGET